MPEPESEPHVSTVPAQAADFDALLASYGLEIMPDVPPCPRCGSLLVFETCHGFPAESVWHCQICESAAFHRGLRLAERAARLRRMASRGHEPAESAEGTIA